MLFNFGKCKCIHIGHGNMDEEYKMGHAVLGRTTQEKDLGVIFSADRKSEQCGIAASKGDQILGLIRRTITYKEKHLIVPLYKAIVRPHLEYCIQAWRPYRIVRVLVSSTYSVVLRPTSRSDVLVVIG